MATYRASRTTSAANIPDTDERAPTSAFTAEREKEPAMQDERRGEREGEHGERARIGKRRGAVRACLCVQQPALHDCRRISQSRGDKRIGEKGRRNGRAPETG